MSLVQKLAAALVAAIIAAAFVASELLVRPKPSADREIVVYWEKWTGFEGDAMRAVVDAFNKSQDKYEVRMLTVTAIQNKTMLATAGGVPPDVAGLFGDNVAQYAMANAVRPLDDLFERDGLKREDYIPVYWNICTLGGLTWALPSTPASTALHYNTDHWKEAGLDPSKPPETIEEFDAMIEKISKVEKDGDKTVIKRAGFLPREPGWWRSQFGYIFGADLWDPETQQLTCDSPENIEAFTWAQSFARKFGITSINDFRGGFGSFSSPDNPFLNGKVSSVLQGVWMANFIEQYTKPGEFHWAAAPFPYPANRPEAKNSTYAGLDVLAIPKGAKNVEGAWAFIKYVQSQEGMELLCMGQGKHTPLVKVSEKFWQTHKNPYIKLFHELAMSPTAKAPPKLGIWPQYSAEMENAADRIDRGEDPAAALKYVKQRMQPKLERELLLREKRELTAQ